MSKPLEHDWEKTNLVTNRDMTDSYRCRRCGITGKRYGFNWPPVKDKKYQKDKYIDCHDPKAEPVTSVKAYDSGSIAQLIAKLRTCHDARDQRRLRVALRKAGHKGGLKS